MSTEMAYFFHEENANLNRQNGRISPLLVTTFATRALDSTHSNFKSARYDSIVTVD